MRSALSTAQTAIGLKQLGAKYRLQNYVKFSLFTLLLLTICAYFSHSIARRNTQSMMKILHTLCELYQGWKTPCCPPGQYHSVKSWFDCILYNSTHQMKSGQPPSTTTTTRVAQLSTIYRHWADKKPPVYHIPPYYYEIRADYIGGNRSCPVYEDRREVAYHLLRYWIELTNKHNIVWWITFGTLLGAIRENDFIPYDTDVDVEVLGDYEHIVRSLAVKRGEINPDRINLITRIGSACQHDGGLKYDCEGHWQTQQTDRCAICYPLGRLFHGEKGYIDIYSSVIRAVPFANPLNPNHIEFNVEQQGSGHRDEKPWLVRMREIFPLSTCVYMGLKVPCPRDAHSVLTKFYGKDYRKPSRFCNSVTGGWS